MRAQPQLMPHVSWQLPLSTMDVCVIFADVNEDDVRAHGGSELQIADSEAITSTVLLREMHAQMHEAAVRAGRRGAPPLTIVTQVRPLQIGLAAPELNPPKA